MAGIGCVCGNRIYDNSDQLSHKARFIPDMEWFEMLDNLSATALAPLQFQGNEQELWHALSTVPARFFRREAFQCDMCGRLLVQTAAGDFHSFRPESDQVSRTVFAGVSRSPEQAKADMEREATAYWKFRVEHVAELVQQRPSANQQKY